MQIHQVTAEKESGGLAKEEQLAWKIAELASKAHKVAIDDDVREMVKNRIIDNAAIAIAAVNEKAVIVARGKALATEDNGGATVYGVDNSKIFGPTSRARWGSPTASGSTRPRASACLMVSSSR